MDGGGGRVRVAGGGVGRVAAMAAAAGPFGAGSPVVCSLETLAIASGLNRSVEQVEATSLVAVAIT